jgi:transcriptional regulator with XRE-family HTH domain
MTGSQLEAARKLLGLTQTEFGTVLGLSGDPRRSVHRYEAGETSIPGPVVQLTRAMLWGYRPPNWPKD